MFLMINHQYEKDLDCSNLINLDNLKHLHCYYNLLFVIFFLLAFLTFFSSLDRVSCMPAGHKQAT